MKCLETESPAYHITAYWQYNIVDDRLGEEFFGVPSIICNVISGDKPTIIWNDFAYIVDDKAIGKWPVYIVVHKESFLSKAVKIRDVIAVLDKHFTVPIREVTKEAIRLIQEIEGVVVYDL